MCMFGLLQVIQAQFLLALPCLALRLRTDFSITLSFEDIISQMICLDRISVQDEHRIHSQRIWRLNYRHEDSSYYPCREKL